jgi:hypothetical protein
MIAPSWVAIVCAASIALSGNADAPVAASPPDELPLVTRVRLAGDHIEYSGIITHEANEGVFQLYESALPRPHRLIIESQGGGAAAAMDLGAWILQNDMDVQVDTYCFSSCANYVFLAGRNKILSARASLMWHGGVAQPITPEQLGQVLDLTLEDMPLQEKRELLDRYSREDLIAQLEQARQDLIARETEFFRVLGVDQRVTSLGHLYERTLLAGKGDYMGWDLSLEDLARLGVRGLRVDGGEWRPVFPIRGRQIYRIRLDDLPGFKPAPPPRKAS